MPLTEVDFTFIISGLTFNIKCYAAIFTEHRSRRRIRCCFLKILPTQKLINSCSITKHNPLSKTQNNQYLSKSSCSAKSAWLSIPPSPVDRLGLLCSLTLRSEVSEQMESELTEPKLSSRAHFGVLPLKRDFWLFRLSHFMMSGLGTENFF